MRDMRQDIKLKYFYFFVMVNVADEPVTDAMRFKYFLVYVWGNAKADRYEIEEKSQTKSRKSSRYFLKSIMYNIR